MLLQHKPKLLQPATTLSHSIQLPIILQIPPSPLLPDQFPKQLHFISITTTHLTQYTMPPHPMNQQ
ncbi:putative PEP-binding protein, partial [Bacillus thuringiensis]|uniref:putative PEP-binding protein n=1 Tax=Bacillus thuringiensis TaxID=1428 RepID=UPI003BFA6A9F